MQKSATYSLQNTVKNDCDFNSKNVTVKIGKQSILTIYIYGK